MVISYLFFPVPSFAQTTGTSSSSPSRYVFGTVYQGSGSTPLPFASVEFRGDASFSQKANSNGGFAFIVKPGSYSVWASATGYQSNVCFFEVNTDPVEVTFVLGRLGVASSSCQTSKASSSEIPIESRSNAQDTIQDDTAGTDSDGDGSASTDSSSGSTGTTTASGGPIKTFSNCVVTIIGKPATSPALPPECELTLASPGNSGGNTGGSGPAGPCMTAPSPPGDIRGAIINKWGITLNLPQQQLQLAWQEFHEIDCTGFLQDLRGTLVNSWGNGYAQQFSCPRTSGEQGETDIMFSNQWVGEFMKAILVHELAHVWQFCSSRGEANLLEVGNAYRGEGGLTKYSRRECLNFAPGLDRIYHEDQADTIALYLNSEQGELTCGNGAPNPFTGGRNPLHGNAAKKGVGR